MTMKVQLTERLPGRPGPVPKHRVNEFSNYRGSNGGLTRPRCKARGCDHMLHVGQMVACSTACLRTIKVAAMTLWEGIQYDEQVTHSANNEQSRGLDGIPAPRGAVGL